MSLEQHDLETFRKFRVPQELLERAGVRRISHAEARRMGLGADGDLRGVFFPYKFNGQDINGRVRRDNPNVNDKGKPENKYVGFPKETHQRCLYYPPDYQETLADPTAPVFLVEAEKSVLAVTALLKRNNYKGTAIGLGGCWGWRNRDEAGVSLPIQDFDRIQWEGRPVVIILDTNVRTNPEVQKAEQALVGELRKRGADVQVVHLPAEEGVNGPDDYIAQHLDADFLKMLPKPAELEIRRLARLSVLELSREKKLAAAKLDLTVGELMRAIREEQQRQKRDVYEPAKLEANLATAVAIFKKEKLNVWYDEFNDRVMVGEKKLRDIDEINTMERLQREYGLTFISRETVAQAIRHHANQKRRNTAQEWLNKLEWDGVERLDTFFVDYFGAEDNEYTRGAGKNFWIGLIARIMKPGCQVDTMVVLEGPQGQKKSSALMAIGGDWFAEQKHGVSDKDFYITIRGKALVEISELEAFSNEAITKVKQAITCRVDSIRDPYDRHSEDRPRQCVLVGTTNKKDWNHDETGARRFWPIECNGEIDVASITKFREQFFAEAVARYRAGESWWEMPAELTKKEQDARFEDDLWRDDILKTANELYKIKTIKEIRIQDIISGDPFNVPIERQDQKMLKRVAKILRKAGWDKIHTERGKVWIPPEL